GSCKVGSLYQFCMVRWNANGSVDNAFTSGALGGLVLTDFGAGNERGTAMALQYDGKIVMAGTCENGATKDFCVARYTATAGALDTTFNSTGQVRVVGGLTELPLVASVLVLSDERYFIVGACPYSGSPFSCSAQLAPNGALLWSDFDSLEYGVVSASRAPGGNVLVLDDAAALSKESTYFSSVFTTRFFLPYENGENIASAIAAQPDGKILVAGRCRVNTTNALYDFCVARYEGAPSPNPQCSLDVDGDGRVLATTDILISARVALGMMGAAVLNGISFPANARRTDWASMRKFLITQCGMTIP
ncbi:MAG: delta-60 repeat domain-containing protein, partial [Casimicrobium sp.]